MENKIKYPWVQKVIHWELSKRLQFDCKKLWAIRICLFILNVWFSKLLFIYQLIFFFFYYLF